MRPHTACPPPRFQFFGAAPRPWRSEPADPALAVSSPESGPWTNHPHRNLGRAGDDSDYDALPSSADCLSRSRPGSDPKPGLARPPTARSTATHHEDLSESHLPRARPAEGARDP